MRETTRTPRRRRFIPASIRGGREQAPVTRSAGGRGASLVATAAAVVPTPLAFVGTGEALPVYSYAWPAWKVAALTLLAVAEAFVLVRIVRYRHFAQMSEI